MCNSNFVFKKEFGRVEDHIILVLYGLSKKYV